jgi:hypothetical protein
MTYLNTTDLRALAEAVRAAPDGPYCAAERLIEWVRHHPSASLSLQVITWAHGVQIGAVSAAEMFDADDVTEEVPYRLPPVLHVMQGTSPTLDGCTDSAISKVASV